MDDDARITVTRSTLSDGCVAGDIIRWLKKKFFFFFPFAISP